MESKHKLKTLGARLRHLREDVYNHSQGELAANIGLKGHVGIYKIETGATEKPQKETLDNIAKVYGTTVEWLKEGVGEMLPNGKRDFSKPQLEVSAIDPWKDALVSQLKEEATTWKEKYNDVWRTLSNIIERGNLGKLNALYFTGSTNRVVKGNRT